MTQRKLGSVLRFDRSAAEVRTLASRQQAHGNPLKALELYHLSLEKAPEDPETILALADTYAQMGCWVLSSEMYFRLAHDEVYAGACFYGIGANFFALHMYAVAHDCFVLALQKDPEADFAPDAVELLEAIDEAGEVLDPVEAKLQQRMGRVLSALDRGQASLAVRQIRRAVPLSPRGAGIWSLNAFALLAAQRPKEALAAARKAVKHEAGDIRSLCAMASALKANHAMDAARVYLRRAAEQVTQEQEDDLQLVCQTACEMGEDGFVVSALMRAEPGMPYSDDMLHMLATALFNEGQEEEAMRRWRLIRRIAPMDSVAEYRLKQAEEGKLPKPQAYDRQVPLSELLRRLDQLRQWVHEGPDALQQRWDEDLGIRGLLYWALRSGEAGVPGAACGILSTLRGPAVQTMLRAVLLMESADAQLKQQALASLYATGAEGPFYAVMGERLTLVHVSRVQGDSTQKVAQRVMERAARRLPGLSRKEEDALYGLAQEAVHLQSGEDIATLSGAVVLMYGFSRGLPVTLPVAYPGRRKAQRLMRRMIKEQKHEMPEL